MLADAVEDKFAVMLALRVPVGVCVEVMETVAVTLDERVVVGVPVTLAVPEMVCNGGSGRSIVETMSSLLVLCSDTAEPWMGLTPAALWHGERKRLTQSRSGWRSLYSPAFGWAPGVFEGVPVPETVYEVSLGT